jgi:hypothetical protein
MRCDGQTDTETDMTKLIIALHNFMNMSKSGWSTPTNFIGVLSIGF